MRNAREHETIKKKAIGAQACVESPSADDYDGRSRTCHEVGGTALVTNAAAAASETNAARNSAA